MRCFDIASGDDSQNFYGKLKLHQPLLLRPLELTAEQIGGSDGRAEPVMNPKWQECLASNRLWLVEFDAIRDVPEPVKVEVAEGVPVASDVSAETIEEDFKIFKRAAPAKPPVESPAEIKEDDELAIIEKNMVRLKELFHEGHITRDVYVDETRIVSSGKIHS